MKEAAVIRKILAVSAFVEKRIESFYHKRKKVSSEMKGGSCMEEDKVIRIFAVAKGRVQGVGFRYFVQSAALNNSVIGWVKNMNDGTVEMELQGYETNVHHLLDVIRKGNMFCRVDSLTLKEVETNVQASGFHIIY